MKSKKTILIVVILLGIIVLLLSSSSLAYGMSAPNKTVHQYISKEAAEVLVSIPSEILYHLTNNISNTSLDSNYDFGNDIITGSGEEEFSFKYNSPILA